jgi:GNAT superfamily N-acetyltransferase
VIGGVSGVPELTINNARLDDLDALLQQADALYAEDAGQYAPATNLNWPLNNGGPYYSELIVSPDALVLLARSSGRVVGFLVARVHAPTALHPIRTAVLESMRVAPSMRNHGVGSVLVREFRHWARGRGAGRAAVTTYSRNAKAMRFYVRHGFEPLQVALTMPL